MVQNHIDLYPEEVDALNGGDTIEVTDREGEDVTIRMKPRWLFDEVETISSYTRLMELATDPAYIIVPADRIGAPNTNDIEGGDNAN